MQLLLKLREDKNDRGFGLLSSHPAAILATLRAFGREIEEVDLKMAREHARAIMDSSPVSYIKEAVLRGDLFETHGQDNIVCCAYTNFWVDHSEPLEVLQAVKARGTDWLVQHWLSRTANGMGKRITACQFPFASTVPCSRHVLVKRKPIPGAKLLVVEPNIYLRFALHARTWHRSRTRLRSEMVSFLP